MTNRSVAGRAGQNGVIPVIAEIPTITRRRRVTGKVRVGKRVVRRVEDIDAAVFHEEALIERRRVNQPVAAAPPVRTEGDTLIVPVIEEVLKLQKQFVVREEIRIRLVRRESRDRRRLELRRELATVERIPPGAPRVRNAARRAAR